MPISPYPPTRVCVDGINTRCEVIIEASALGTPTEVAEFFAKYPASAQVTLDAWMDYGVGRGRLRIVWNEPSSQTEKDQWEQFKTARTTAKLNQALATVAQLPKEQREKLKEILNDTDSK